MTYRESRLARADRLREWAEKREAKAEADYKTASDRASIIPFGQPILVGHYSERRDRNYREKISRGFERSFESADKARNMASRADGIEAAADRAIYDDDPDAIDRLREKLEGLQAKREAVKARDHASYELSNLSGNIKRTRDRIARLESRQAKTGTTAKPPRLLSLKYAGTCQECSVKLEQGTLAYYDRAERAVTCRSCQEGTK